MTIFECPLCGIPPKYIKSTTSISRKLTMKYCKGCRYAFIFNADGTLQDVYRDVEM